MYAFTTFKLSQQISMADTSVLRSFGRICSLLILLSSVVPVLSQTVTTSVQSQPPRSHIREGDAVGLQCRVQGFDPSSMFMSWTGLLGGASRPQILTWQGMMYQTQDVDPRYSVVNDTYTGFIDHYLVINSTKTNHSGTYNCRVMQSQTWRSVVVASEVAVLTVYPSRIFPICSPNGTAEVPEGSPMNCTVNTTYSSAFIINTRNNTQVNWNRQELNPGVRLTSSVSSTDDGQTYSCSSVSLDYLGMPFTCQIGPLSVPSPPATTESPAQEITTKPPSESQAPDVPERTASTFQPNTSSAGTPVPEPTPSDSAAPTKPEGADANPPAPVDGGKSSNTADNSPPESGSPKPRPPVTSRALNAILIIIVIAVAVITVVALVMEHRKSKRAPETEKMEYHKVDAEKI